MNRRKHEAKAFELIPPNEVNHPQTYCRDNSAGMAIIFVRSPADETLISVIRG